jgi:hypothetical protein
VEINRIRLKMNKTREDISKTDVEMMYDMAG